MSSYVIRKTSQAPEMSGNWDGPVWSKAETICIDKFHKNGKFCPVTKARILHDGDNVYVHFKVEDKYVRAAYQDNQDPVCRDSCAEFFVRLVEGKGYFNFEINCCGTILLYFIRDARRNGDQFADSEAVSDQWVNKIEVYHSLNGPIVEEQVGDIVWYLEYKIPRELFEAYLGPLGDFSGQTWSANLYKCGDELSHPHWAMWNDVEEPLNFHKPEKFLPVGLE